MTLLRLAALLLLLLLAVTLPLLHAYGENYTCHFAPSVPEDRRPRPSRLRIVQVLLVSLLPVLVPPFRTFG